jgi:predicted metal-dependent hydrolase
LPTLDLGDRHIQYAIVKGKRGGRIWFRFRTDMTLEVVLPRGKNLDIEKEVRSKSAWLRRTYERLSRTMNVLDQETVMYGGRQLRVVVNHGQTEKLVPDLERGVVIIPSDDVVMLRELVRRWFLAESSSYAVKKVAELAPKVGAIPTRVDVREIGKWGYCTRSGRLTFSWQLIALPENLREYVVLHELTHLLEFNHSPAFRSRLATVCPDFRAREGELDLVVPYDRFSR